MIGCSGILLTNNYACSQTPSDTLQKKSIVTKNKKDTISHIKFLFSGEPEQIYSIDTSLNNFEIFNPAVKKHYVYSGNVGAANYPLIFSPSKNIEFNLGYQQFDAYLFDIHRIKFYNTTAPFTEATFILGKKDEQYFRLTHAQNIKPNFNFGFDFQKISSDGIYLRQKTNDLAIDFFTWYQTPNQHYNLFIAFAFNRINNQENGGVDINLFESDKLNTLYKQRKTISVKLSESENHWDKRSAFIQQSWDFGKSYAKKVNDTLKIKKLATKMRIAHNFTFQNNGYKYNDLNVDASYYPSVYFAPITYDSTHTFNYENKLSFRYMGFRNPINDTIRFAKNIFEIGLKHNIIDLFQSPLYKSDTIRTDTFLQSGIAYLQFGNNPTNDVKFFHRSEIHYGFLNYNENDFFVCESIGYNFSGNSGKISLNFSAQQKNPVWIAQRYRSNHFWWDNNFEKEKILSAGLIYSIPKNNLEIKFTYYSISDFIYWDTISHPRQFKDNLQVVVLSLKKDLVLKNFHFNNYLVLQNSSTENYIHLPIFYSYQQLYYQNLLFKKALLAQFGFDARYKTDYFANSYMPASGQFHLQNKLEMTYYPVVDFFINMKIKRARIFLKIEHLNELLTSSGYYDIPHYPMPDWTFKLGIDWIFYK